MNDGCGAWVRRTGTGKAYRDSLESGNDCNMDAIWAPTSVHNAKPHFPLFDARGSNGGGCETGREG